MSFSPIASSSNVFCGPAVVQGEPHGFHDFVKALRTSIGMYMKLPQSNTCENAEPVN